MVGYILGFYTNNDTFFQYTDNANIKVSAMLTLFDGKGDLIFCFIIELYVAL